MTKKKPTKKVSEIWDKPSPAVVEELTPELADKIWKSVQKSLYDKKVSKEAVLHHLKQLKAQMGGIRVRYGSLPKRTWTGAIDKCIDAVTKKIEKITNH